MIAKILNIKGETSTDDIQLIISVQYTVSGVEQNPPQDSVYTIIADHIKDSQSVKIEEVGAIVNDKITFNIPKAQSIPEGMWSYRIKEVTSGNLDRTPVRGKMELVVVPQPT